MIEQQAPADQRTRIIVNGVAWDTFLSALRRIVLELLPRPLHDDPGARLGLDFLRPTAGRTAIQATIRGVTFDVLNITTGVQFTLTAHDDADLDLAALWKAIRLQWSVTEVSLQGTEEARRRPRTARRLPRKPSPKTLAAHRRILDACRALDGIAEDEWEKCTRKNQRPTDEEYLDYIVDGRVYKNGIRPSPRLLRIIRQEERRGWLE